MFVRAAKNSNSATPLIYGDFDSDMLRVNGILDINSAYQFPTIDGTSGQVLQTDGSGTLSWSSSGGGGGAFELNDLIDGLIEEQLKADEERRLNQQALAEQAQT